MREIIKLDNPQFFVITSEILEKTGCIRFRVKGQSMSPIIKDGDLVEIKRTNPLRLKLGDIAMFTTPQKEVLIHRLIKRLNGQVREFITKGDNSADSDLAVAEREIWGVVSFVQKQKIRINLHNPLVRLVGLLINRLYPWRRFLSSFSCRIAPQTSIAYKILLSILTQRPLLLDNKDIDWQEIIEVSIKEGLTCLLYKRCKDKNNLDIPQNVLSRLEKIYLTNLSRNIIVFEQLKEILLSLKEKNIKNIVLKGAYLLENIYQDLGARGMADIDILVRIEDLTRIDKVLYGLGYKTPIDKVLLSLTIKKSYLNSINYFKTDGKILTLHIHWHIVNVTLPTYMYSKNIKMDKFWECASPAKIADAETLQLAPHHLIMLLAEHALRHSFDRLILFSDISAVIKRYGEQINWEKLIKETVKFGMEKQVFYSLYFTNYFLDTDIPLYILSKLRPKKLGFLEQRFFYSISNNSRNAKLCYFIYLNMVKGTINKFRFIFRTLFPPSCVLALSLSLNRPKATIKDYFLFLRKQLFHLKNCLTL